MFIAIVISLLVGAGLGYGFRGLISKEKNAVGATVTGAVTSAANSAAAEAKKL